MSKITKKQAEIILNSQARANYYNALKNIKLPEPNKFSVTIKVNSIDSFYHDLELDVECDHPELSDLILDMLNENFSQYEQIEMLFPELESTIENLDNLVNEYLNIAIKNYHNAENLTLKQLEREMNEALIEKRIS